MGPFLLLIFTMPEAKKKAKKPAAEAKPAEPAAAEPKKKKTKAAAEKPAAAAPAEPKPKKKKAAAAAEAKPAAPAAEGKPKKKKAAAAVEAKPAAPAAEGKPKKKAATAAAEKPAAEKKPSTAAKAEAAKKVAKAEEEVKKKVNKPKVSHGKKQAAGLYSKKPKPKTLATKPKTIKIGKKKGSTFHIDCRQPVEDGILNIADFETFLQSKIRVNVTKNAPKKTKVKAATISVERSKTKVTVVSDVQFSKKYLKYLTKKYLQKNSLRDWLRVVTPPLAKDSYELRYFQINNDDEEEAED